MFSKKNAHHYFLHNTDFLHFLLWLRFAGNGYTDNRRNWHTCESMNNYLSKMFPICHSSHPSKNSPKHSGFTDDAVVIAHVKYKAVNSTLQMKALLQFVVQKTRRSTSISPRCTFVIAEPPFCQPALGNLFLKRCFESINPSVSDASCRQT